MRQAFLQPSCVQGRFNPADESLARHWHSSGVPLESACNAILLGCARKSIALLQQPAGLPIRSLHYFQPLLAEVLAATPQTYPPQYWQHLRQHLLRCEQHWARHGGWPAGPACPPKFDTSRAAAADTRCCHYGHRRNRMMMLSHLPGNRESMQGGASLMAY